MKKPLLYSLSDRLFVLFSEHQNHDSGVSFMGYARRALLLMVMFVALFFKTADTFGQSPDAINAVQICDGIWPQPAATANFGVQELNLFNRGCLLSNEVGSNWYWVKVTGAGSMAFSVQGLEANGTPADIDGAVWGPFTSVAAGASAIAGGADPIRCSYSLNTGMELRNGVLQTSEGQNGNGVVGSINVSVGQYYLIIVDNFDANNAKGAKSISWNFTSGNTAQYECPAPPVLPAPTCASANGPVNNLGVRPARGVQPNSLFTFTQCNNFFGVPFKAGDGTFTQCYTVNSGPTGNIGAVQQIQVQGTGSGGVASCLNNIAASRVAKLTLKQPAPCAPDIPADILNAGNSTTFNPEWTGLTPNTDYILCIETTMPAKAAGVICNYRQSCLDIYHWSCPLTTNAAPPLTIQAGAAGMGNVATDLAPTCGTGPYSYGIGTGCTAPAGAIALPASSNLTIAANGMCTYTAPPTPAVYFFCAKVCDSSSPQQCKTVTYTTTVTAIPLTITQPATQTFLTNVPVTTAASTTLLPAGGTGTKTYSNGSTDVACVAPAGALSLPASSNLTVSSSGAISYTTPTTAGVYYYCVKVCDSGSPQQCAVGIYKITVGSPALAIVQPAAITRGANAPTSGNASTDLSITGGTGTITYSNGSSDPGCVAPVGTTLLPASSNLTVSLTGAYSYTTPTTAGTYYFCVKVCDSSTPTPVCAYGTYKVTVLAPITITQPVPTTAGPNSARTGVVPTPTGGTGPYTYSNGNTDPACVAPAGATLLPASSNLSINASTGAYSYTTPTVPGTYYFCVKICDSSTPTPSCVVANYTVTVAANPLTITQPVATTKPVSTPVTGTTSTDVLPAGGTGAITYSNGGLDPACVAPAGATAQLPASSNLTINSTTGAYSYTTPSVAGTYYFCVKVCDSASPTPVCQIATYKVTVSPPACNAGNVAPGVN